MDVQLSPNFNFITFLLFISFIFLLVKGWKRSKHQRLPPSPWKLPLLGHLHHLVGAPTHRSLANLAKKYGPLIHLQLGEVSAIVVSSRQIAKDVLKGHDVACADRPESIGMKIMWYDYTNIAFSPYNEYWKQMRKICIMELLSNKNVRAFGSLRVDEASRLVKSIQSSIGEPVNLTERVFSFTSSMTCRVTFGQVLKDKDTLIALMRKGIAMGGGFELADLFPSSMFLQVMSWNKHKLLKMRRQVDSILDLMINEHKNNLATTGKGNGDLGGDDIVDVLLKLQQSGKLAIPITNDNIKAIIFDLFAAGTQSSSTTIDWAMAQLMRNPHVMKKAQDEIRQICMEKESIEESDIHMLKYLKLVVKETFRMHPPFSVIPRASREEFEIEGYTIPFKTKVMVNNWALGRDPEYWDEPEIFKPERFDNNPIDFLGHNFEYIPFGTGKRFCPGMNFGLANVELPLAQLLYHFNWTLPKGMRPNDIDLTETEGLTIARKNGLYLIPKPWNPSFEG